jgi:hypothetical protein
MAKIKLKQKLDGQKWTFSLTKILGGQLNEIVKRGSFRESSQKLQDIKYHEHIP